MEIIMAMQLNSMFFSATGTTKKVVSAMTGHISKLAEARGTINIIDFTLPASRQQAPSFSEKDLVIIGIPVIAGRVPNVLLKYLNSIHGNGALAAAVVVYGNRNYDDALVELKDILELDGFKVVAGGAFIGEHSFSKVLAANRPDDNDLAKIEDFARKIYNKITNEKVVKPLQIKGDKPYRDYYKPRDKEGNPVDFRKIKPKTTEDCIDCKLCANICPMGSIAPEDVSIINGICIKCCACIKECPVNAKYFDSEDFIRHKNELEIEFARRREPEIFI
ncbi:MAG: EFR1 family ferrodoxin [Methylocystaceae bacterium]